MVTGTIIAVIGISLMRVGINWILATGRAPPPPCGQPEHIKWLTRRSRRRRSRLLTLPQYPRALPWCPPCPIPAMPISRGGHLGLVLLSILLIAKFGKGFIANISVLLGIIIGAVVAVGMG